MNIRKSAVNYNVGNTIERRQTTAWDLIPNYQICSGLNAFLTICFPLFL